MKHKIAVVEEINNTTNITGYLKKSSQHSIISINNIIDFHSIAEHRPSVIVIHDTFEGGGSEPLCFMLKQNSRTSAIPLLLLTNRGSNVIKNCKFDDLLIKPFTTEQLLEKITKWVVRNKVCD